MLQITDRYTLIVQSNTTYIDMSGLSIIVLIEQSNISSLLGEMYVIVGRWMYALTTDNLYMPI